MDELEQTAVENDAPAPAAARPASAPARAERGRGGCLGRLLAALLVVIITSFIALAAVASGLLYLGFTPNMAQQLGGAQAQIGTLQAQNSALQTEVAAQSQRGTADHEVVTAIERQIADLDQIQRQIREEREASVSQNATLVAEAHSSRDAVALFATAEAGRALLLQQLEQRSARIERFLQRLSDIAGDAALDLNGAPAPAAPAAPTTISELSPTPTPSPGAAPSSTATTGPTETTTPTPAATVTRTPRATTSPSATLGR